MLNRIVLIGRLTRDPEMKYMPNTGLALASFTLAVDRYYQGKGKEKETDFIRIVAWDKLAERCKEQLSKGRLAAVDGRLMIRNWETAQGERRTTPEVRADVIRVLDRAQRSDDHAEEPPIGAYDDASYDRMPEDQGAQHEQGGHSAPPKSEPPKVKQFGNISDKALDEEIDLDDDDPFGEGK